MGKKLKMVAQTTKDLQKMCKQLDLTMHLVVSDDIGLITTACGSPNKVVHIVGDGIASLAEQMDVDVDVILAHLIVYLKGEEKENDK